MKKKKLAGIFMSLSLAAGVLAGCAGDKGGDAGGNADTIKVGVNLELSGNVASYGQSMLEGVELAVKEINKEGIDGKKIELVTVDNKSEAAESTNAAIKLTSQEKVAAIIGPATSGDTKATIQIAQDNQVPVIAPGGTAPELTFENNKLNDFIFRTSFIDPFQGVVAANFAANELKVKNAAVFIDKGSDYSGNIAKAFTEQFEANGGKVVTEEAYVAKDTDFRATLTRIKAAKPDFVLVPGYYEEVGLIVKQAREIGLDVPFMGGDGWDSPTLVEIAGADALNNTFFTNHYSAVNPDEKIQNFIKAFGEEYDGEAPDAFNALGYDTAYFLADAIKRAGSADSVKIKEALETTKDLSVVTGTFTVDEKHNPIKSAIILEMVDGKQTYKTQIDPQ